MILYEDLDMRFGDLSFGSIRIDGKAYDHDVVVDCGKVHKRKKKPSRRFRGEFGHTRSRLRRRSPGDAAGWWSARVTKADCR